MKIASKILKYLLFSSIKDKKYIIKILFKNLDKVFKKYYNATSIFLSLRGKEAGFAKQC